MKITDIKYIKIFVKMDVFSLFKEIHKINSSSI